MIKMIAMDMDGTLLSSKLEILEKTKETLINAERRGVTIVLASGRSHISLMKYGEKLRMNEYGGYYIGANGATLTNATTLEHKIMSQLNQQEVEKLFDAIKPFGVEISAVVDNTIYDYIPEELKKIKKEYRVLNNLSEDIPWTAGNFNLVYDQRKNGYTNIININKGNDVKQPVNKMCFSHKEEILVPVHEYLIKEFGDTYHFARTSATWIECTHLGINKGDVLLDLAKSLNIENDEILTFGDGENDISMIKAVKHGIAMGNAMETVKKVAYDITEDNDSNGIANYLNKIQATK